MSKLKKLFSPLTGVYEVTVFAGYSLWLRLHGKYQDWNTGEIRDINPKEDDDKNV